MKEKNGTKRIESIQLQWVQSIRQLDIQLDNEVTRISGKNASGKSAIAKGLSLFTGTYKRGDIKGIVSNNRPKGSKTQVLVTFINGEKILAEIGDTSSVKYIHFKENKIEKVWENHNQEILDVFGWRTIGDDIKTSLDIKNSKKNLLIDTTARENAEMVDDLYRNIDIELRIHNLEENLKEIIKERKTMKDKRATYYSKKEESQAIDKISLGRIDNKVKEIDKRERKNEIRKILYKQLRAKKETNNIIKILDLIGKLDKLNILEEHLGLNRKEKDLTKLQESLEDLEMVKRFKEVEKNMKNKKILDTSKESVEELNNKLNKFKSINSKGELVQIYYSANFNDGEMDKTKRIELKFNGKMKRMGQNNVLKRLLTQNKKEKNITDLFKLVNSEVKGKRIKEVIKGVKQREKTIRSIKEIETMNKKLNFVGESGKRIQYVKDRIELIRIDEQTKGIEVFQGNIGKIELHFDEIKGKSKVVKKYEGITKQNREIEDIGMVKKKVKDLLNTESILNEIMETILTRRELVKQKEIFRELEKEIATLKKCPVCYNTLDTKRII